MIDNDNYLNQHQREEKEIEKRTSKNIQKKIQNERKEKGINKQQREGDVKGSGTEEEEDDRERNE